MKSPLIVCTFLIFNINLIHAQEPAMPAEVRTILNSLQGDFHWKIIRPSDSTILRTGTKTSKYDLDSLVLLSHETFDDSQIKQMGIFGYKMEDSSFFSIGLYNVDLGPHISTGYLDMEANRIEFIENDSSRFYLHIINPSKYYWTYTHLEDQQWEKRDMEIVFERK